MYSAYKLNKQGDQSIGASGASASASVLPKNIQDQFPLRLTGLISCSPRDSQESSPPAQFKSISSSALSFLYGPTLTSIHDYWKNHSFDYMDLNPEYSLEGLMLKLKLQYFGHLMQITDSMEKTLMLGKNESRRRRGWQMLRWLDVINSPMDMSLSKLWVGDRQGSLVCCSSWGRKELDMTNWLNWTEAGIHAALTYSFPNLEPVHCSMSYSNYCFLTCIHVSQEASKVVSIPISLRIFHNSL